MGGTDQPTGGELSGCAPHHSIPQHTSFALGWASLFCSQASSFFSANPSGVWMASFSVLVPDQHNQSIIMEKEKPLLCYK
jgi:hypothetical protein